MPQHVKRTPGGRIPPWWWGDLPRAAMSGYDRTASAHTVHALTPLQLDQVRAAARSFLHETWFAETNPAQLLEFLYLTACHPDVLARPVRAQLRSSPEVDGTLHVRWTRPKKRGMRGEMDLPIAELGSEEAEWIPRFIERTRAHPYTRQWIWKLLKLIGEKAGVPVSPRTIRHTRGVDVGRETRDPGTVGWWLNCSPEVAQDYLRVSGSSDPRILRLAVRRNPSPSGSSLRPPPGAPSY